jgi:hypothetical protein
MSSVHTYFDPGAGAWRNRLAGRDPFPMTHRAAEAAVASGRSLAHLFGADHFVLSNSGQLHAMPGVLEQAS